MTVSVTLVKSIPTTGAVQFAFGQPASKGSTVEGPLAVKLKQTLPFLMSFCLIVAVAVAVIGILFFPGTKNPDGFRQFTVALPATLIVT